MGLLLSLLGHIEESRGSDALITGHTAESRGSAAVITGAYSSITWV